MPYLAALPHLKQRGEFFSLHFFFPTLFVLTCLSLCLCCESSLGFGDLLHLLCSTTHEAFQAGTIGHVKLLFSLQHWSFLCSVGDWRENSCSSKLFVFLLADFLTELL
jgi:hypothetical protein